MCVLDAGAVVQCTVYPRFNAATHDYDGQGRNPRDNDSLLPMRGSPAERTPRDRCRLQSRGGMGVV